MSEKIKYTAFIDILGFSNYMKQHITNDVQAEEFYNRIDTKVINYFKYLQHENHSNIDGDFINDIKRNYTWISDTFVITIEYDGESKNKIIPGFLIYMLSMAISDMYHFFAKEYKLMLRGAISSKYTFINHKVILGEGIDESAKLEKQAVHPRVIFADNIITEEILKFISLLHNNNLLNIVSKDCDGYYFVNYIGALQEVPPMINTSDEVTHDCSEEKIQIDKMEMVKKYWQIADDGLKDENPSISSKYKWLMNYIERLLPSDGKSHNEFAYNLFSKEEQKKFREKDQK